MSTEVNSRTWLHVPSGPSPATLTKYSLSQIVQITDFLDFLNEYVYCEGKSKTFTEFLTNFILTRTKKSFADVTFDAFWNALFYIILIIWIFYVKYYLPEQIRKETCAVVVENQQKITYDREFSIVKYGGLKYMNL